VLLEEGVEVSQPRTASLGRVRSDT